MENIKQNKDGNYTAEVDGAMATFPESHRFYQMVLEAVEAGAVIEKCVDSPLYPDDASALFALHAWIATFLAQFVGDATPEEVVSWPGKAIDAADYIAGTATDKQKALIEIEATARGGSPVELATLIAANAAVYDPIIRAVPGLRRATVVALGAATTSDDREAVLTAAKAKAEALLAQVMGA